MSTPILYVFELSPPARAVRLVAESIHLELDIQCVKIELFYKVCLLIMSVNVTNIVSL